jgi:sugar (pentulose or hexulose) kinase
MSGGGPLLAAVDVGTTGARAAAIDPSGTLVAETRRPYRTRAPHPGWAEQDAAEWGEHAVAALAALSGRLPHPERVAGIGLTGQCPTVAPVGADGRPVGPGMLYRDNRAVAEAREMRDALGPEHMHARTGHVAEAFHIGPKVLWLRRHLPDVYAATRWFLQPRDVVLRRLTGRVATDETHADATMFFDLRARRWADDLLTRFDVDPGLFPEALPSWETAAQLPAAAAAETGLRAGIPIVIGAADSQCVAFGAGVVDPGPVSEMAGASSCLNSAVTEPLPDIRITHYSHVVPDRFTTELGINTSGAAIDWAVRRLGYGGHAALAADAERLRRRMRRPGADPRDLAPIFLPYLGDGERDDPDLRGAFVGLSLRHDRPALAYAVLEGIAFGVHGALAGLEAAGSPVDELRIAGGGGRLAALSQIKADALMRPVLALQADAAAIGTALLAAGAAGMGDQVPGAVASVLRSARRYEPSPAAERLRARREWYETTRAAAAVRGDWGSG